MLSHQLAQNLGRGRARHFVVHIREIANDIPERSRKRMRFGGDSYRTGRTAY